MTLKLSISPDFSPEKLSAWYFFNTWLQRQTNTAIHLELQDSFSAQRQAIQADQIDLIFANPYDAAMLVREKGFKAVAQPHGQSDEAIVVVAQNSPVERVEALRPGLRIACTADPDVRMMGLILLEPAGLSESDVSTDVCTSHALVAKQIMNGQADAGIVGARAYDGLSSLIRNALRPLVRSEISVVRHMLLAGPKATAILPVLQQAIAGMAEDEKGADILRELGFVRWESSTQEDVEFMIDLMDTLVS